MPDAESAGLWESISPERRQSLADSGVYLPGSEEWKQISDDLAPSTTINHVFHVVALLGAKVYSETFANFALEIVQSIPAADFFKYFRYERLKKLSKAKYHRLTYLWTRRMRIFRFDERVTEEHLSTLRGLVDEGTPIPFIDVLWYQRRMIELSIRELLGVTPAERTQRTALLSVGLEAFNLQRDETRINKLLDAIMATTIKKQWGGARRKPKDFTPEMCERFAKKTNELRPLWDTITQFFEDNHYNPGCAKMVKGHSDFETLSAVCTSEVPEDLLKRVFQRQHTGGEEYWPQAFAVLHAKIELGVTNKYAISTLHGFYRKGSKLLRERSEPNAS